MNRTTTLIAAAVLLVLALYAAVHFSGRTTTQPTESPTPPASTAPAPTTPTTPAPGTPAPANPPAP